MVRTDSLARELEPVAKEILSAFAAIADAAKDELDGAAVSPSDVFANTSNSTFTSASTAAVRLADGHRKIRSDAELLRREPAIARVVCSDGEREVVSYICRATPPIGSGLDLISQRAAKGRLAALPIGESLTLPNGKTLEVLNRIEVHPEQIAGAWDSKNNLVRLPSRRPITIESLAALLGTTAIELQDLLSLLVAEESQKDLLRDGQKRSILTSMQLRDQAILDAHQDAIFRLPISEQIFLSGPPGTGKTTTLIRRLGQKLDIQYLGEDEAQKVHNAALSGTLDHASSWIMFTPTELLRQYVKEAFSRERIPASDQHIKTWDEFRRDASRNTFKILRSAVKRAFVLRHDARTVNDSAVSDQKGFYEDFDSWQRQILLEGIKRAASALSSMSEPKTAEIGRVVTNAVERSDTANLADLMLSIERQADQLRSIAEEFRAAVNLPIEGALNRRLNSNRNFIADLAAFLQQATVIDDAELDEGNEEEEEEEEETSSGLLAAVNAYKAALRAQARAKATKGRVRTGTRNAVVLEQIGSDELDEAQLGSVGESLVVLGHARHLLTNVRRLVFDIPKRFRSFRRVRQREGRWFSSELTLANEINELELDTMLLSSLRVARDLVSRTEVRSNLSERSWILLQPVVALYRNQVLADEATDFSPLQLACMAALMHPSINSFFASGDFNQRLSPFGIANASELLWISPKIELREISVLFRQSRRLQFLSQSILRTFDEGDVAEGIAADTEGNEVSPVLLESHGNTASLAGWLASRVREIERSLGQLPSIAVFVASESEVEPLSAALNVEFSNDNLQAVACVRGQIKGQDTDVRVFDVRHVKGLEFEAAFFAGVDILAQDLPYEFARYLYVGATRAATYLGMTCERSLPQLIEPLRNLFASDWSSASQQPSPSSNSSSR